MGLWNKQWMKQLVKVKWMYQWINSCMKPKMNALMNE